MEGRAREGTVRLLDDDDVDRAGEGGRVDLIVEVAEVADELADVVHTVHLKSARHRPAELDQQVNAISEVFEVSGCGEKNGRL